MLVLMEHDATQEDIQRVGKAIEALGYRSKTIPGEQRVAVGVVGNDRRVDSSSIEGLPGVQSVVHVSAPYKLVSREWKKEATVISLPNGTEIGGKGVVVMGGPCSVESESQIRESAALVRKGGGTILRGGAFKPRTSPYAFQGLGETGLKLMRAAADEHRLAVVTEALDEASADLVAEYADVIQIGARNMANYALLRHVGRMKKPVLLKRGMAATIKEFLLAAEYLLNEGNEDVMLCERGIRSFDDSTRNVMDIAALSLFKSMSHLPAIADPSHGTGRRDKVVPMARAAIAAGADGVIVEMHPQPENAKSDGAQSLYPDQFADMVQELGRIAVAVGRSLEGQTPQS